MQKTLRQVNNRITVLFLAQTVLLIALLLPTPSMASAPDDPFLYLKRRLSNDGFTTAQINRLLDPAPPLQYRLISKTLAIKESRLDYNQFLTASSLSMARRNLNRYAPIFTLAEQRYGVDRSVIAAILLVETRFGGYTGQTPTLAILASYAVMNQPQHQDMIWSLMSAADRKRWGREAFEKRLQMRSEWAYPEICALLRLSETQGLQVTSLRGSVMGAFGWPQFLPSSMVRFGVDGNGDNRVDLDLPEDAIHSVAGYLRGHGWKDSASRYEKEDVIHHYNKSQPYVQTVLAVAERLAMGE